MVVGAGTGGDHRDGSSVWGAKSFGEETGGWNIDTWDMCD